MAEPTSEKPDDVAESGRSGLDQSGIDALHQGGSEDRADRHGEEKVMPGRSAPSDPGEINQDDVDALVHAAGADSGPVDSVGHGFAEAVPDARMATEAERLGSAASVSARADGASAHVVESVVLPELTVPAGLNIDPKRVTMLGDVNLPVKIELGRTQMLVEDVLKLDEGSVVELDKLAGDPVDVYINDRLVARGEVLVLNDNFCVRINEVVSNDPHRVSA